MLIFTTAILAGSFIWFLRSSETDQINSITIHYGAQIFTIDNVSKIWSSTNVLIGYVDYEKKYVQIVGPATLLRVLSTETLIIISDLDKIICKNAELIVKLGQHHTGPKESNTVNTDKRVLN